MSDARRLVDKLGSYCNVPRDEGVSLPTGIFYAGDVKADVVFFGRRKARPGQPWTERLWVYDLRTNQHFTQKQNPLCGGHLQELSTAIAPARRAPPASSPSGGRPTGKRISSPETRPTST